MQFITYLIFLFFIFLFRITPFRLLYIISDFFYFILYYIVRYRKKVVNKNLKNAFPEKNDREITALSKKFYKNLTDILLEGIKGFSMSNKQIIERHKIINPEILDLINKDNKSIITVLGHYCNWEWGSISGGLQLDFNIVAFYKPLSNKYIDKYLKKNRSKANTYLASINKTFKTFNNYKDKKAIIIMVADQSPSNAKTAYWFDFLNQPTAWLHGPEKYAKLFNYPIYYIDIKRVKRGYYTVIISNLVDNPLEMKDGEITKRYVKKLESVITEKPENWLWSHKRWKIKYQNDTIN